MSRSLFGSVAPRRLRLRLLAAAVVVAIVMAIVAACGGHSAAGSTAATLAPRTVAATTAACGGSGGGVAPLQHVVWIVMENESYSSVIGTRAAPYLTELAASCGLATQFTAEAHPSLPNYIAMTSGSTQRIGNDAGPSAHRLDVPSIFSQLGTRWRGLDESMPRPCAPSDAGEYAVRHNPAAYYSGVRAQCATQDIPLRPGARLTAPFTFVTPNLCHDMHSCPVGDGDRWLSTWLPGVLRTPEYRSGSTVVFITWDEGGSAGQHIPTLVVSRHTPRGARSATPFNHYSLLRTTEEILGLPALGGAAQATSMRGAFGLG
jgi:hypothetical protein